MNILQILESIAATSSKLEKEAIITRECGNSVLTKVFRQAYEPRITYGIKKIPSYKPIDSLYSLDSALGLLMDTLATRQYTGQKAIDFVAEILSHLSLPDAEVISRVLNRDLRIGCSTSTINKVFPKLISEYPYMQYSLLSKVKSDDYTWKEGVFAQTKEDGLYASINHYADGELVALTRQGAELPSEYLSDIFATIKSFYATDMQYHGEILVKRDGKILPREIANGIVNSISKNGAMADGCSLMYVIWDMVSLKDIEAGISHTKYGDRFAKLSSFKQDGHVKLVESTLVHSKEEAFAVYSKSLSEGKEGVMLKCYDLPWKDHKSTRGCKLKLEVDVDLEIIGFTEGKGKRSNTFGAITCKSSDRLLSADVSGFDDETLLYAHVNRDKLIGTIMTVKANEVMKGSPASLFLPRWSEFRQDKTKADTYQEILDQFENAKKGK